MRWGCEHRVTQRGGQYGQNVVHGVIVSKVLFEILFWDQFRKRTKAWAGTCLATPLQSNREHLNPCKGSA
jgi:hypothetical protein